MSEQDRLRDEIAELDNQIRPLQLKKLQLHEQLDRLKAELCPDCNDGKLLPKIHGGVHCDRCDYWFCY